MNSTKKIARAAGLLWLLAASTAGFSLVYVRPQVYVSADAAATVKNLVALESLFRAAIASSVLSQIFALFFGLTIFRVFRNVNQTLTTFFMTSVLLSAAIGVVNALNNLGALLVVTNPDYMKAFPPEQIQALVMIFLRLNNFGIGLMELFTALYMFSLGLLIIKSGYLPRVLAILLMVGACAFPINTFTKILIPQFHPALITQLTMLLNALGAPGTILWLLIKGVKAPQIMSEAL